LIVYNAGIDILDGDRLGKLETEACTMSFMHCMAQLGSKVPKLWSLDSFSLSDPPCSRQASPIQMYIR